MGATSSLNLGVDGDALTLSGLGRVFLSTHFFSSGSYVALDRGGTNGDSLDASILE